MQVIDAWINTLPAKTAAQFAKNPVLAGVAKFFGESVKVTDGIPFDAIVAMMDAAGVDRGIITAPLLQGGRYSRGEAPVDDPIAACDSFPDRFRAAFTLAPFPSVRVMVDALEQAAKDPRVVCFRIVPLFTQEPINSRMHYPIYERCEALGIPVSINVGIPGPKVRGRCQDPMDLDDVCIDFPKLTIVASHMGHPWESLLIRLMMKYENLYLMNSAYLAKYMEPSVVSFMDSSRGRDRLLWASDFPMLSVEGSVKSARALDISDEGKEAFLGGNAAKIFPWDRSAGA
ncbi:amidohydrolase family protein [Nocardia vaccinii]|uniref:amidohydrolase family protein n=1 Tax=Nocardia vaccinii TaxID=1822 RepID=UPI000834420F|nr:amidohydrolase family protein [Nocardia vaccinii]